MPWRRVENLQEKSGGTAERKNHDSLFPPIRLEVVQEKSLYLKKGLKGLRRAGDEEERDP